MASYGRAYDPENGVPDERGDMYDRDEPARGAIQRNLERLTKAISEQSMVLEALAGKLQPITNPGVGQMAMSPEKGMADKQLDESPMANLVRDLHDRVDRNIRDMRAIIEAVEL